MLPPKWSSTSSLSSARLYRISHYVTYAPAYIAFSLTNTRCIDTLQLSWRFVVLRLTYRIGITLRSLCKSEALLS
jgi:hypothetical protein